MRHGVSDEIIEIEDKNDISELISRHVNTDLFMRDLLSAITQVDNHTNRAKLMLELVAYTAPKIKAIDKDDSGSLDGITINFIEANREEHLKRQKEENEEESST